MDVASQWENLFIKMKAKLAVQLYGESLVGRICTCEDFEYPLEEQIDPGELPVLRIIEVIKPQEFSNEEQVVAIAEKCDEDVACEIKEGAHIWLES